jgi:pimeloyl-ACP methyl ester carboxylesterase
MTLASLHPQTLRTLVLDSLYPPDPLPPPAETVRDARQAFFGLCAQEASCAASYPDLAASYAQALSQLEQSPLTMLAPPPLRQLGDEIRLTALAFELLVTNLLYFPSGHRMLPRTIRTVRERRTTGLVPLLASLYAAATTESRALNAAVECRDRPHLRAPPKESGGVDDRLQLSVCDDWVALGPPPVVPAASPVPTLILAGELDPVARPGTAKQVAERIGQAARVIEFAGVGHNVRQFSACGERIAAAFIDEPGAIDASCADQAPPLRVAPPE